MFIGSSRKNAIFWKTIFPVQEKKVVLVEIYLRFERMNVYNPRGWVIFFKGTHYTLLCAFGHRKKEASAWISCGVLGVARAKGILKILHELLNHGGLATVARAGITYLTSKCLAGAASLFWVFSDRTLNHVPVAAESELDSC